MHRVTLGAVVQVSGMELKGSGEFELMENQGANVEHYCRSWSPDWRSLKVATGGVGASPQQLGVYLDNPFFFSFLFFSPFFFGRPYSCHSSSIATRRGLPGAGLEHTLSGLIYNIYISIETLTISGIRVLSTIIGRDIRRR